MSVALARTRPVWRKRRLCLGTSREATPLEYGNSSCARAGWVARCLPLSEEGVSVSSFDVRVFAIRRRPGRATVEVRWRVADGDKSRSFVTRALADSYRAELMRGQAVVGSGPRIAHGTQPTV
jgi:hypothetical protein